jgi:tetratricopeptide (TPR) repeat protein
MGDVVANSGDLDRSQVLYEEALEIWKQVLKPEQVSISLGRAHYRLGSIHLRKGRFPDARIHLDRSEEILERYTGSFRVHLAYTLLWQAILDSDGYQDHERAIPRLKQALRILEEEFGPGNSESVVVRLWLGRIHYRLGEFETAEVQFEHARNLETAASGEDSPMGAFISTGLAAILRTREEYEPARKLLERALEIFERSSSITALDKAWTVRQLAGVYRNLGEFDKARFVLTHNIEELESMLGKEHPELNRTLQSIGYLEYEAGNLDRARQNYRRALEIQQKAWGPEHSVTSGTLYSLACFDALDGKPEQALDLLRSALDRGFDNDFIFEDPDMESLRGTPEFEEILAEVRRRRAGEQAGDTQNR